MSYTHVHNSAASPSLKKNIKNTKKEQKQKQNKNPLDKDNQFVHYDSPQSSGINPPLHSMAAASTLC